MRGLRQGAINMKNVQVKFFGSLKEAFGVQDKDIELEDDADLKGLLNILCDSKQCRQRIFNGSGGLKPGIQILRNRLPVQSFNGMDTLLEDGDTISIIPPMFAG